MAKPCGPVWDVKCEEWQMSCCISPNGAQAEWTRKWEWEESQDAGRVRHSEHPQSKRDTKHRVFVVLFSRQKHSSPFTATPETSSLTDASSRSRGLMPPHPHPFSIFFMCIHTHQLVRADTVQEGGAKGWRQAVSEWGHEWWTKKLSNQQTVNVPHFICYRGGQRCSEVAITTTTSITWSCRTPLLSILFLKQRWCAASGSSRLRPTHIPLTAELDWLFLIGWKGETTQALPSGNW